jgi:hypothetical protein
MRNGEVLRDLRRGVTAVVVDDDQFDGVRLGRHKPIDLGEAGRQAARFVVRRDYNGKKRWCTDD